MPRTSRRRLDQAFCHPVIQTHFTPLSRTSAPPPSGLAVPGLWKKKLRPKGVQAGLRFAPCISACASTTGDDNCLRVMVGSEAHSLFAYGSPSASAIERAVADNRPQCGEPAIRQAE